VEEPKTVLVVDDDLVILQIVAAILETEGYRVQRATNGCEGLKLLKDGLPDLILLDVDMPVMDGCSFARELHGRHNSNTPPIVLLTAESNARTLANQIGAVTLLPKPLDFDALVSAVALHTNGA